MSLSVLQMLGDHILYDSEKQKAIMSGGYDEMYEWKNSIETEEQNKANRIYMDQLREERIGILVSAGHTQQSAKEFLQKQMPYLYDTN